MHMCSRWSVEGWRLAVGCADLVGRGSCAVPRHRLHKWPRHGLQIGQDIGNSDSQDMGYTRAVPM
jgi:hypothetical protein